MPNLTNGKTLIGYTGAATTYTAVAAGEVLVKLWGAGGGGTASSINNGIAGAGGFTTLAIEVAAGDVIKVEVGQGGQPGIFTSGAQGTYTGTGGAGGWPDGGDGGANIQSLNGGGGGSTRVYKNNVLVGVAAAGGGCGFQTTTRQSGAGGGTVGQDGTQTLDATGGNVSGATQTAGGVNSTFPTSAAPFYTGASLQGGHGFGTGQTRFTNGTNVTGAGGGGGFFGGGGAGKAGYQQGASGGSSYVAPSFNGSTTGGNRGVPGGNTDKDYTSGVGVGGTNNSTLAPIAGGNGQAVLDFAPIVGNLSTAGKTTVTYQNPNGVVYNVTKTGRMIVKLWGGGGGALYLPTVGSPGGAGGYTTVALNVNAGDSVRVEVGQGGQIGSIDNPAAAQGSWVGTGGVGGWPDGGNGASNQNAIAAGGGGSSRIYINGVLQAVAGAGGGAGATSTNRQAGAGGGTVGQDGTQTLDATGGNVSGATQTAGGVNSSFPSSVAPFYTGGPFQGGHGYATGQTNATDNVDAGGSGGGGGFFGGGGAGKPSSYVQGASGGSGFIKAGLTGATTQGNRGVPANNTDPDLPAGKAIGGTNNTPKSPLPGGDGVVVIDFNDLTNILSGQTFTVPFTGVAETYTVQADGIITFEAWGGGGSQGTFFNNTTTATAGKAAGAGAYVLLKVPVKAGDVIKMEAAQGGQKATASADTGPATAGGLGGWPDGGSAGLSTNYTPRPAFGGGGGSTRIYKNNVLVGVAAGGGGGIALYNSGAGGTLDALWNNSSDTTHITPATQYAGGTPTGFGIGGGSRNFGTGQSILTSPLGTGANGFGNAANNATAISGATAGAGGGYWGGGCFYDNTQATGSGGGSSYIHPDYLSGSNWLQAGATGAAPLGIGTNKPTGIGDGGVVNSLLTLSGVTAGGNGAIWMQHTPNVSAGTLPNAVTVGVERLRRSFTADRNGTVTAKLWGGAGAGGTYFATTAATRKGGAGGYTEVQIPVVIGDVISVEVGQGGQKPWSSLGPADGANSGLSTTNKPLYPGAGGWPDGGTGGRHAAAPWGGFGGGGGSTRVYKNGVLVGVAAGGGGSTGLFFGGSGGATVGGQSADSSFCGTGGTQSAGGTADGASLKGAPGYVTDASAIETTSGAGGGGGYFGGGSNNGRTVGGYGSGGGGSAYMDPSLTASTTSGARDTGIPYDGTNGVRPAGVAVGGSVSTAANTTAALAAMTAGGDGAVLLNFPQPLTDGVPVTAPYSGIANTYVMTADGVLNLEAWGGGGGGGPLVNATVFTSPGGAGGNINGTLNVFKGDVIKVEVGQGGRKGVLTVTGGLGGWPDGGAAGMQNGNSMAGGGGGGSTRVYLNDVLIAVAAAGSGGSGFQKGAPGGGLTGQAGVGAGVIGGTGTGGGGTQTAGGTSADAVRVGGKFKGGQGWSAPATGPSSNDDGAGSGGGGGWFGGGGGGTQTSLRSYPSGGGGSSYSVVGTSIATNMGTDATPFDSGHKPAGAAQGGPGGSTSTFVAADGGDGAVYLKLTASADQASNVFKATGADQTWTAPTFGTLRIKGYAAGGGGGNGGTIDSTHPAGWGGPGGYIDFSINVATGDVITIEVGKGGVPGTAASGAFGGWPDGGNSGRFASGGINGGSGGGSTRIYKNGVLEGIAGAGGGGIGVTSGGAGGGLTGDTGTGVNAGTGGTQTAGGDTPNHQTATPGISFHGGNGYVSSITAADDQCGGGGGGGYFGGGGGYAAGVRGIPGGGGGSSSFGPDAFNTLTQKGTTGTGTPFQSSILVPFVGYGGIGQNAPTTAASGYDGLVAFYFTPIAGSVGGGPIPTIQMSAATGAAGSTVFGNLGNPVAMTAPAVGVNVGVPIGGFPATPITMTPPDATPAASANWTFAPLGTVTMLMNLVGLSPSEAILNLPVTDTDIVLAMGTTTEIHAASFVDKLLLPLIVRMTNPRAFILGFANGDLGTDINLTTVTAGAENGPEAPAVLDSVITVSQPVAGSATGSGLGYPFELTFSGNNPPRWFAIVGLNGANLTAVPQSGAPAVSTDPIPQINVQLPLIAFAEQGIEVFADVNSTVNLISNLGATGAGSALATVRSENSSRFFPDLYVARVLMVPAIDAQVHGGGDFFALNQPVTVVMQEPAATASHGAFALSSILPARIVMRAPQAVGFAGNFALAIPDMEDLVINMSEVTAFSPVTAQAFSDPILVDYVDGYAEAPLAPGLSLIKWKRSQTPGAQPLVLAEREVALNEYDGVLYSRDGQGKVRATPYLGFGKGRTVPAGGADGLVLGVDLTWKSPPTGEGSSRLILPPTGSRFLLANNFTGTGRSKLEAVVAGSFPVHYRPFFLPKATQLSALSVEQLDGNLDAQGAPVELRLWMGVCEWDPILSKPTIIAASNHLDVADGSGNARREVAIGVTLSVGWYAAMFGAHSFDQYGSAAPTATFQAWKGGASIGDDFFPRGEPIGVLPIGADFTTPPAISRYATVQAGDVSDHAFVQATSV